MCSLITSHASVSITVVPALTIIAITSAFHLFQVIKNPVTDHLPTGCRRISTSYHADLCTDLSQFATDRPIVFVVGAMAHGKVVLSPSVSPVGLCGEAVYLFCLHRWRWIMPKRKWLLAGTHCQLP